MRRTILCAPISQGPNPPTRAELRPTVIDDGRDDGTLPAELRTTFLIAGQGDRFAERIATDGYLRGEVWGFVLLEVHGDQAKIRALGHIGARDAGRVTIVATARRDRDLGDEDDGVGGDVASINRLARRLDHFDQAEDVGG